MSNILDQLHTDHINVAKLLDLFENELEEFSSNNSEPDYLKWQNILLYMTTYQDIFHHPTEDKLFAHIRTDDPEIKKTIDELESQHKILSQTSKNLHELIGSVETSRITMDRGDLIDTCRDFINQLLKHMSLEEKLVFPFVKKEMLESDWIAFEKETEQIDDPLFGAKRRADFADLYQCIYVQ